MLFNFDLSTVYAKRLRTTGLKALKQCRMDWVNIDMVGSMAGLSRLLVKSFHMLTIEK